MSWAVQAQRAWQARTSEEIARSWIGRMVERTPLEQLDELALGWLGREAPALVAELLTEVNAGHPAFGALPTGIAERTRALVAMRSPARAAAEVPRDLALLQALLAEALARNAGEGDGPDGRAEHLVQLFGELHSEFAQALVEERFAAEGRDAVTGGHDERALRDELGRLVAAGDRGAGPFAVLELDVDGLRRVNDSAGPDAGDHLMRTVADAARVAIGGPVFRREGDELVALVPGSEGPAAAALAAGVREAVARALGEDPLRSPLSIGVAAWPAHGGDPDQLLERAREATYLAKSSGHGVALANGGARLQRS